MRWATSSDAVSPGPCAPPSPRRYRVAMVAACPYPTTQGSQVYIGGQTEALARRGHEVHVVTYHFGEDVPAAGRVHRIPGLPGYTRLRAGPEWRKPVLDAMLAATLLRVVREHGVDVMHAHNYEAPLAAYLVRAATRIPVVYNSHNTMGEELHLYFRSRPARAAARAAARVLDAQVPRRADHVVAISPEGTDLLRGFGVPGERISLVPPGVFTEEFDGDDGAAARVRYGIPPGPAVLYTGNPDRYQDLPVLLDGFARARRRVPDARLVLVSGSPLGELRVPAARAGILDALHLIVTSRWSEVRALLAGADVAAISRGACTGFPIKLLNYMAAGLPVVATAASAKAVLPGETGLVVGNGDAAAFGEALAALLSDPVRRRAMGDRAREVARARHHWDGVAASLEEVYARVVGDAVAAEPNRGRAGAYPPPRLH